jgi:CheY-like chemotaxis protein/signal transduction histidine kinase
VPTQGLENINLTEYSLLLNAEQLTLPQSITELVTLTNVENNLDEVSSKDGRFWYIFKTNSETNIEAWINISNRLVKNIRLYQVKNNSTELLSAAGMLHAPQYPLTYGQKFTIPKKTAYWIIEIEHPYIMGNPQISLSSESSFKSFAQANLLIVIACIGTILLLAPYNFLIGFWSKNPSYFWYAAYLLAVGLQWTTFYTIWEHFFGVSSDFFNFTFFNLYVFFGINFYLSFLRLENNQTWLVKFSRYWRYSVLMIPGYFLWPPFVHYALLNMVVGVWIFLALTTGIVSYRNGYRPARFFILGFSLIFISALTTILSSAHIIPALENSYRFSLIAQTLDVICLSLALADQINTLRDEKVHALQAIVKRESHALEVEKIANKTMVEANLKLDTALQIALQDKKQKQQYMMLIGHELKTPLHTIFSIIESAEHNRHLSGTDYKSISTSTNVLKRHITNLLTLAETSAGMVKPLPTKANLKALSEDLITDISNIFPDKSKVTTEFVSELPSNLMIDCILLQHLMFELVHNAVRFSNGEPVVIRFDYQDSILNVDVIDQGPGFPIELIEEFNQQQSGFTRDSQGLGIGLSIANNLLNILGANLEIQRNQNGGTTISFHLFCDVAEEEIKEPQKLFHCLVVEDNPVNQKLLIKMLEKSGYLATGADNGQIAVDKIQNSTFDIVLMDLQMPVLDGFEATKKIREMGYSIPIIAVTANTDYEARNQALLAGVDIIVGKPVKKEKLNQLLSSF